MSSVYLDPFVRRVLFTFKVWIEKYGLMEDDPHIIPALVTEWSANKLGSRDVLKASTT
ncbi:hypothetical protein M422DRAFT_25132 [Sphaerobolus stellatus SS14]|nr:hypothetical protein M422DRAFT_25132 [Sphaerobolus stellatus SS14]